MSSSSTSPNATNTYTDLFPSASGNQPAPTSTASGAGANAYYLIVSRISTDMMTCGCGGRDVLPSQSHTFTLRQADHRILHLSQFLGVLAVLICMASCLAFRAFRIRRRYRTATQLAIARGDPVPRLTEDYWRFGTFSPWTHDGWDRHDMAAGMDGIDGRGRGKKWAKVPELWEAEVDGDEEKLSVRRGVSGWRDIQVRQNDEISSS